MQGREKESNEATEKALILEGSKTKAQKIEVGRKKPEPKMKRGDFLHLKVFRRDEETKFNDKSETFKFNR